MKTSTGAKAPPPVVRRRRVLGAEHSDATALISAQLHGGCPAPDTVPFSTLTPQWPWPMPLMMRMGSPAHRHKDTVRAFRQRRPSFVLTRELS